MFVGESVGCGTGGGDDARSAIVGFVVVVVVMMLAARKHVSNKHGAGIEWHKRECV
jgi:hypothetical protein